MNYSGKFWLSFRRKNPFATLDMNDYRRGKCAAENIYIVCCILQHISGNWIHCGEGGDNSENNRSLCGYYLRNASRPDIREFSTALSEYAIQCYRKNVARKNARERERERENIGGKTPREYIEVTTLFDELFHWNNLVIGGLQLCRFDINSPVSRAQTAYNVKTNIIHLCDTLDKKIAGETSYYDSLCREKDTLFSFRIGHVYYGRNYLTSRFPALYCDTNLGSNFITGASGIFDSVQLYKLNRGLRHLDGHIDTNLIEEVLNSVACAEDDVLDTIQLKNFGKFMEDDRIPEISSTTVKNEEIRGSVNHFIKSQCDRVNSLRIPLQLKFRLYCSILSIALNWRSFLLCADGQGVEHSDTETEAVRMIFMLAYRISNGTKEIGKEWLNCFSCLFMNVSKAYWQEIFGIANIHENSPYIYNVDCFQGFKSPNSVVPLLVKASKIFPEHT